MSASIPKLPTWYRVFAIIVGVMSIAVALIVLVEPLLAIWLLILLLALGLLVMGMDRLIAGITGHPMAHVIGMMPLKESPGAASGQGPSPPKP